MPELNKIYQGDCLSILKSWEAGTIDCLITSPPYWGLRAYQTNPQIWDGTEGCEHNWQEERTERPNSSGGQNSEKLKIKGVANFQNQTDYKDRATYADTCSLCGAWRGELGLEPTFQLYISHLIQIFDEVKRVLKPTGTCWVNLGDSYSGNQGRGAGKGNEHGQMKPQKSNGEVADKSLCCIPDRFKIAMVDNPYVLREDLSEEDKTYVLTELVKRGII